MVLRGGKNGVFRGRENWFGGGKFSTGRRGNRGSPKGVTGGGKRGNGQGVLICVKL